MSLFRHVSKHSLRFYHMTLVWTPPCSTLLYSVCTDVFKSVCMASFSFLLSHYLCIFYFHLSATSSFYPPSSFFFKSVTSVPPPPPLVMLRCYCCLQCGKDDFWSVRIFHSPKTETIFNLIFKCILIYPMYVLELLFAVPVHTLHLDSASGNKDLTTLIIIQLEGKWPL